MLWLDGDLAYFHKLKVMNNLNMEYIYGLLFTVHCPVTLK